MYLKLINLFNKYKKFIKFCFVGALNTIITIGVYYLLIFCGVHYLISNIIGYFAGMANSYLLNNSWVFRDLSKKHILKVTKFLLINVIVLLLSEGLLYLFVDLFGIGKYIAIILVVPITTIINYVLYNYFVFWKNK